LSIVNYKKGKTGKPSKEYGSGNPEKLRESKEKKI